MAHAPIEETLAAFESLIKDVGAEMELPPALALVGLAGALCDAMQADGVDLEDADQIEGWISRLRACPEEERKAFIRNLVAALPRASVSGMPPVRLASARELASAARACPALDEAHRLALWVGDGLPLTNTGVLRRADALRALRDLGLLGPNEPLPAVRSARDLPRLHDRFLLATGLGLLERTSTRVRPGPMRWHWAGLSHETLLDMWENLFDQAVAAGVPGPRGGRPAGEHELVNREVYGIINALYYARGPMSLRRFADEILARAVDHYDLSPALLPAWSGGVRAGLDILFGVFADLGAVTLSRGQVTLTPLGVWVVRERLASIGVEVPLVGSLVDTDAAEMLAEVAKYPPEDAREEIGRWVAARPRDVAASSLLAAARQGSPTVRGMAFAALVVFGREVEPLVRQALAEPMLRAHAAMWLLEHDYQPIPPVDRHDADWMLVDTWAALLESAGQGQLVTSVGEVGSAEDQVGVLERLWRVDHPHVMQVLEAIRDGHPNETVARAARKATFRTVPALRS